MAKAICSIRAQTVTFYDARLNQEEAEMNWIASPESSNVARFGYDRDSQYLDVEYTSGTIYRYFDIPEAIFSGMQAASSKGQFLAEQVKGSYRYARL